MVIKAVGLYKQETFKTKVINYFVSDLLSILSHIAVSMRMELLLTQDT